MKLLALALLSGAFCIALPAQELMKNGDFNEETYASNVRTSWSAGHFKTSLAVEDLNWNRCLKTELLKTMRPASGAETVSGILMLGASGRLHGIPVKPMTRYRFRFEAKGDMPGVGVKAALFHNDKAWYQNVKYINTSLGSFKPSGEWKRFEGTFLTGKDTKRASLVFQFWGNSRQQKNFTWKKGQSFFLDNVSLIENPAIGTGSVSAEEEADKPKRVLTLPSSGNGTFTALKTGESVNDFSFDLAESTDGTALRTTVRLPASTGRPAIRENGSAIWKDDVAELFFQTGEGRIRHFGMASGGGRWTGNGEREEDSYDTWRGETRSLPSGMRELVFETPYTLLGFAKTPPRGTTLAFNLGIQCAGRNSSYADVQGRFNDPANFGVLILGNVADYLKNISDALGKECPEVLRGELEKLVSSNPAPEEAVRCAELLKKKIFSAKLGRSPFLAGQFPVTADFAFPLNFSQENVITGTIRLRAARNERKSLPFAVMNRTGNLATYRIIVHPNLPVDVPEFTGLRNDFPAERILLREALAVRDSDRKNPGMMFDPLPLMNSAQTITVPPGRTGLVWITFDCRGATPGRFHGAIRVIPLMEPGQLKRGPGKYTGEMKDYPLELEVLPLTLPKLSASSWLMCRKVSEDFFRTQMELMEGRASIGSWSFPFRTDEQGNILNPELSKTVRSISEQLGWFKKYGIGREVKFTIDFSFYPTFERNFMNKKIKVFSPEWENAWKNCLKATDAVMKAAGVPDGAYEIEVFDEPKGENFKRDLAVCRLARETLPNTRLIVTWPPHNYRYTPDMIRKFLPHVNGHILHHLLLADPAYHPLIDEIKKTPGAYYGFYACSTNIRESLHRYFRMHAWKGFRTGADIYGFYMLSDAPWGVYGATDWKTTTKGGITYRAGSSCIPSIRMEALREGLTDIAYLELLREKRGATPEVEAFLRKAADTVVTEASHDPRAPDRIRGEIIRLLLEK